MNVTFLSFCFILINILSTLCIKFNSDGTIDKLNYAQIGVVKNKDRSSSLVISGFNCRVIVNIRKSNILQCNHNEKPLQLLELPINNNELLLISLVGESSDCNAMKNEVIEIYDDYYTSYGVHINQYQLATAIADSVHHNSLTSRRPLRCNVIMTSSCQQRNNIKNPSSLLMIDLSGNIYERSNNNFDCFGFSPEEIIKWHSQQRRKAQATKKIIDADNNATQTQLYIYGSDYDVDYYNIFYVYIQSLKYFYNKNPINSNSNSNSSSDSFIQSMKLFLPCYIILSSLIQMKTQTDLKLNNNNDNNNNNNSNSDIQWSLLNLHHTGRHSLHHNQMKHCFDLLWDALVYSGVIATNNVAADFNQHNISMHNISHNNFSQGNKLNDIRTSMTRAGCSREEILLLESLRAHNYTIEIASVCYNTLENNDHHSSSSSSFPSDVMR